MHQLPAPGVTGKILFSAKEAVYKCQYPLSNQFLGFHAVEVELGEDSFQAVFQQEAAGFQPGDVVSARRRGAGGYGL